MSFLTRIINRSYNFFSHIPSSNFNTAYRSFSSRSIPKFPMNNSFRASSLFNQKIFHAPFANEGTTINKTRLIGLAFLAGILFVIPLKANAYGSGISSDPAMLVKPIIFSASKDIDWVRQCIDQYPEILWLADESVRKTEEAQASLQGSYSEQLFDKKFIEFDRTIMTLHSLKLILDGSDEAYLEFTKDQQEDTKLSRESFQKLHEQGMALLKSKYLGMSELELMQALEASLVLGDIGKSEKAREIFKTYGAKAPDHDDFHEEVIQILQTHPKLCPTFDRLSPAAKQLITQSANLAHYGHITHIEGGPDMFSKLNSNAVSSIALSFDFFVHICDVAGALGHVNKRSSLVCTEPTYLAMQGVLDSCKVLASSETTEIDAYNTYLSIRANWLGLNPQDRTDRVLTRMGAMLRLFTPEDGTILKQAVQKLSPKVQAKIIEQLDVPQKEELERTPTYMPAVLVNLANNPQLGKSKEERISKAVTLGLPFLVRVLETHKEHILAHKADPTIPLNFNKAAGVAKINPKALSNEYNIDPEGNVIILDF